MNIFRRIQSAAAFRRRWKLCNGICFLCRYRGRACDYVNPYIRWM